MRRVFTNRELDYIKNNYQEKTYRQITHEINLFNNIKKNEKQVRTKASTMGLSKIKYHYNKDFFETIDTKEKAYWLGFIFADGWVQLKGYKGCPTTETAIELQGSDAHHLEKLNISINGNVPVKSITSKDRYIKKVFVKGGKKNVVIRLFSAKLTRDLIKLNVVPNKTYRNDFPVVPSDFFKSFLLGFFDGDGTLSFTNNKLGVAFTNPNGSFLDYIGGKIKENGFHASHYVEDKWKERLVITSHADIFLDWLYENEPIKLTRKYNKYLQHRTCLVY